MSSKVTLHRCPFTFLKTKHDSCWHVQDALDEQGIEYEVAKHPLLPRSRRKRIEKLTGQRMLPLIEFEDGTAYREESAAMVATVRAGQLFTKSG
jgi:glutathione S-transferase